MIRILATVLIIGAAVAVFYPACTGAHRSRAAGAAEQEARRG